MIKKIINWFKSLFESNPTIKVCLANSREMSKREFAAIRNFFNGNLELEIERISDDGFNLWKLVPATDENGTAIKAVEQVGYYNAKDEILFYNPGFDSLYQIYSKNA